MSNQVHRVVKILSRLSAGHVLTVEDILDYLKREDSSIKPVSPRQIERDLRTIMAAGVAIDVERRDRKVYYSQRKGAGITAMSMATSNESFLLYMLKASLPMLRESSLQDVVDELRTELEYFAPGEVVLSDALLASISLGHYAGGVDQDILSGVIASVAQKKWIKVMYGDQTVSQLLFPFKVIPYLGRLYVAIWHNKHKNYGVYAIDKIRMLFDAPSPTPPVPQFDLEQFMSTRFGLWEDAKKESVKIEIAMTNPRLAEFFMSSYWHPTQEIRKQPDGTLLITMQAGVSPELVSWVLHWAPDLKVVSPQRLLDQVQDRAKQLLG
jgi:predicted DNA-binding transcriptional regulator YafY